MPIFAFILEKDKNLVMNIVSIKGDNRTTFGKKANKALRKEGRVPCVIYGGEKNIHFSAKEIAFKPLIYTPEFKLAEITIDDKTYKCFLKDSQFHPVTDKLVHLDFIELVPNKEIRVELPVVFRGVSPGVKIGGKLIQSLRRVKVRTTPENLVDTVVIDISNLQLGQAIRVKDIDVQEGIEIINTPSIPVAVVEVPRALRGDDAIEAEAEAEEATAEAEA